MSRKSYCEEDIAESYIQVRRFTEGQRNGR